MDELQFVILDGVQLALATDPARDGDQSISQVCPKVRELDLSRNLFERFGPVVQICSELKLLRSLKVKCVCLFAIVVQRLGADTELLVETGSGVFSTIKSWSPPAMPSLGLRSSLSRTLSSRGRRYATSPPSFPP